MRLVFDHNLSPRLIQLLSDVFADSVHVRDLGLESAPDSDVWDFARANHLTIVSKDSDFHQRSLLEGFPPKAVWIRRGNCTTGEIEALLPSRAGDIATFEADEWGAFLELE